MDGSQKKGDQPSKKGASGGSSSGSKEAANGHSSSSKVRKESSHSKKSSTSSAGSSSSSKKSSSSRKREDSKESPRKGSSKESSPRKSSPREDSPRSHKLKDSKEDSPRSKLKEVSKAKQDSKLSNEQTLSGTSRDSSEPKQKSSSSSSSSSSLKAKEAGKSKAKSDSRSEESRHRRKESSESKDAKEPRLKRTESSKARDEARGRTRSKETSGSEESRSKGDQDTRLRRTDSSRTKREERSEEHPKRSTSSKGKDGSEHRSSKDASRCKESRSKRDEPKSKSSSSSSASSLSSKKDKSKDDQRTADVTLRKRAGDDLRKRPSKRKSGTYGQSSSSSSKRSMSRMSGNFDAYSKDRDTIQPGKSNSRSGSSVPSATNPGRRTASRTTSDGRKKSLPSKPTNHMASLFEHSSTMPASMVKAAAATASKAKKKRGLSSTVDTPSPKPKVQEVVTTSAWKHTTDCEEMKLLAARAEQAVRSEQELVLPPLLNAIRSGDKEETAVLLKKASKEDVNHMTSRGDSAMHAAAELGDVLLVQELVKCGGDVNLQDKLYKMTPLHLACKFKRTNVVQFLLRNGADQNAVAATGDNAISMAVHHNAESVVKTLLDLNADVNSIHPIDGQSLLHAACATRYLRIARLLIRNKANPHINSNSGETAFQLLFKPSPPSMAADRSLESIEQFIDWLLLACTSENNESLLRAMIRDCKGNMNLAHSVRCGNCSPISSALKFNAIKVACKLIDAGAPLRGEQAVKDDLPNRLLESDNVDIVEATISALLSGGGSGKKKQSRTLDLSGLDLAFIPPTLVDLLAGRGEAVTNSDFAKSLIDDLSKVEVLNLANNKLVALPLGLLSMPKLDKIRLEGNPLSAMPEAVTRGGVTWYKVKEYLESLKRRAEHWSEFKLLVTGQENVGKTTLIRAMKSKKGKTQCKQNLATHGIETQEVTMSASTMGVDSNGSQAPESLEMTFNAWDMGGQAVFYPTHTLFLTVKAIYLVVFDVLTLLSDVESGDPNIRVNMESSDARVSYWMQQIRNLSNLDKDGHQVSVFLVGSHIDMLQDSETQTQEEQLADLKKQLQLKYPRQRFPGLEGIHLVSSKTAEGMQELKEQIVKTVRRKKLLPEANEGFVNLHTYTQRYIAKLIETKNSEAALEAAGQAAPAAASAPGGMQPEQESTATALSRFPDMISRHEMEQWAVKCGVPKDQLGAAIDFLRDVGLILYFSLPKMEGTEIIHEDLVVLNPQWLADVMASMITFKHKWVKHGVLPLSNISMVFSRFPRDLHGSLLQLLENFSIVYRIRRTVVTGDTDNKFHEGILVPSMLPEVCQEEVLAREWALRVPGGTSEVRRVYTFPFLPLGFFNRIMVRLLHLPGMAGKLFWQTGAVLVHCLEEMPPLKEGEDPDEMLERHYGTAARIMLDFDPVLFQFTILVRTLSSKSSSRWATLQVVVNSIETALEELGMRDVAERTIPCTHCLALQRENLTEGQSDAPVFMFTYAECAAAIMEGKSFVFCNHICSPSRVVALDKLAPDISLSGVALIHPQLLELGAELGKGGFGTVYRATLQPPPGSTLEPKEVAVKEVTMSAHADVQQIFTDFQQEVFLMSSLGSHPNLVNLIGVCLQPKPRMILELLQCGDLCDLLHPVDGIPIKGAGGSDSAPPADPDNSEARTTRIRDEDFPWKLRLWIAMDVAKGMYGMHSHQPPILHRDLRSPNIFMASRSLDAPVRAKVADFGLSRMVAPTMIGALDTWQWLAPEVLGVKQTKEQAATGKAVTYNCSSDVYSFGICCWELATAEYPFQEYLNDPRYGRLNETTGVLYPDVHKLKAGIANDNLRPSLPPRADEPDPSLGDYATCPTPFAELMEQCWHADPQQRPNFQEVIVMLAALLGVPAEDHLIELEPPEDNWSEAALEAAPSAVDSIKSPRLAALAAKEKKRKSRLSKQLHTPIINDVAKPSPGPSPLAPATALADVNFNEEVTLGCKVSMAKKREIRCAALVMPVLLQSTDGVERKALELWVGCKDGTIVILDATDLTTIHQWRAHDQGIQCILVVKHHVWVASKDGYLSIWDIQNIKQVYEKRVYGRFKRHVIRSMALVRCQETTKLRVWLSSDTSSTIHVYEPYVKGCQLVSMAQLPKKGLRAASVRQHGSLVWVSASDHIVLYDPDSLECVGSWAAHKGSTTNDSCHVREDEVWSSAASGQLSCWKMTEGSVSCSQQLSDYTGSEMNLLQVVGEGTPNKRVWCSTGTRLLIWDLGEKPKVVQELVDGHSMDVSSIVSIGEAIPFFRADEKVWTFGKDGTVALWVRNAT